MRLTSFAPRALLLGSLILCLMACGIGGPGDNNNNNLQRPDSGADSAVPDGGGNNNNATSVQSLTVEELRADYIFETLGQTIVDLRGAIECQLAHIPDAYCVPEEELWDGSAFIGNAGALTVLTTAEVNPLIFYGSASQSQIAQDIAEAALGLGYSDVYVVEGGIEAWRAKGWYQDISRQGILEAYYTSDASENPIPDGVFIVDTMDAQTYAQQDPFNPGVGGHIKCAVNVDGNELWYGGELKEDAAALLEALGSVQEDPTFIFYCVNSGCASSEAASFAAEALGYSKVLHYSEGLEDWQGSGHLVVTGTDPCGN
ncbi:MAG: rhodanese-like domain-containing protein [Polyangia bacterium]|jgi:3-mercaptopyruvate sulfurtransferase SseA|nr:rhodanese-like domain-containing protein [Polyangia bacterium]